MTQLLTLESYDGTTRLKDPYQLLPQYTGLSYDTGYPGGLFLRCSFRLPLVAPQRMLLRQGHGIKVKHQDQTVWEGVVQSLIWHDAIDVSCIGWWGHLLMRRVWHKHWADSRISEDVWTYNTAQAAAEKCFVDRNDRIRFTPKAEQWGVNEGARVNYASPTGTSIARIEYDYDFDEQAQPWALIIRDETAATDEVTITTTGSAAGQSHDFSPVSQNISLNLRKITPAGTPTSNGDYFGEFSNITVFAEWEGATPTVAEGTLNIYQLCLDYLDKYTGELSATPAFLDSALNVVIEPFISQRAEPAADILIRAAQFGDASGNPVAVGIKESDLGPDNLPVLFAETYAATSDYEYRLNWNDANRVGGSMAQTIKDLANYIYVEYTDEQGRRQIVGPADDATLTDATSTSQPWGQIDKTIRSQETTQANAIAAGVRYLAHFKDAQWYMRRPVVVEGTLQSKRRTPVPVSQVRAGQRILITDFADEDKVMVITHALYDAERNRVSITAGLPPFLMDGRLIK